MGLLGFASMLYHYGWKVNQTNLHLIDAFSTASAWQAECTTQFFLSPFLFLSTGHSVTYQETSLYYQGLVVARFKIAQVCSTKSFLGDWQASLENLISPRAIIKCTIVLL